MSEFIEQESIVPRRIVAGNVIEARNLWCPNIVGGSFDDANRARLGKIGVVERNPGGVNQIALYPDETSIAVFDRMGDLGVRIEVLDGVSALRQHTPRAVRRDLTPRGARKYAEQNERDWKAKVHSGWSSLTNRRSAARPDWPRPLMLYPSGRERNHR